MESLYGVRRDKGDGGNVTLLFLVHILFKTKNLEWVNSIARVLFELICQLSLGRELFIPL